MTSVSTNTKHTEHTQATTAFTILSAIIFALQLWLLADFAIELDTVRAPAAVFSVIRPVLRLADISINLFTLTAFLAMQLGRERCPPLAAWTLAVLRAGSFIGLYFGHETLRSYMLSSSGMDATYADGNLHILLIAVQCVALFFWASGVSKEAPPSTPAD